jgi:hypothetical protein
VLTRVVVVVVVVVVCGECECRCKGAMTSSSVADRAGTATELPLPTLRYQPRTRAVAGY